MIAHPHVKINLGLSVIRKRADGYHDLETVFVPYREISDTLEIVPADTFGETAASLFARYGQEQVAQAISPDGKLMITLARAGGVDWDPLSDLTARAYGLLDADFQLPPVKIYLEKTSPVGAGLGGGSSDAAFALRMLADLFNLPLSREQLAAYAARLGSDCAFFIYEEPMLGTGRGEVLTPFPLSLEGYQPGIGMEGLPGERFRRDRLCQASGTGGRETVPVRCRSRLCGHVRQRQRPVCLVRQVVTFRKAASRWRRCPLPSPGCHRF